MSLQHYCMNLLNVFYIQRPFPWTSLLQEVKKKVYIFSSHDIHLALLPEPFVAFRKHSRGRHMEFASFLKLTRRIKVCLFISLPLSL